MSERFTDHLRAVAAPIWRAQHEHPFIHAIAGGSVDRQRFGFWVRQDYLFLIDYARLFAIATARAPDLDTMRAFANLAHETLETEMGLHRAYAAEFGISAAQLEAETKAPITHAYTDFLLRTAALGDYAELVGALLPCMWAFAELATAMRQRGLPDDPLAAKWIEAYSAPEFVQLATWCRDLLDRLAAGLDDPARRRVEDAFITSSRYELRFWQMAQTLETWES